MCALTKIISDKTKIIDLVTHYFAAIDEKQLNANVVEAAFTSGAQIIKPNGAISIGHENILNDQLVNFARFKAMHQLTSDYLIDSRNEKANR